MVKSEVIIQNSIDNTGKQVKSVRVKKISKLKKIIWELVWQYFRDRNRKDVKDVIKKYTNENKELKITYSELKYSESNTKKEIS